MLRVKSQLKSGTEPNDYYSYYLANQFCAKLGLTSCYLGAYSAYTGYPRSSCAILGNIPGGTDKIACEYGYDVYHDPSLADVLA